MHKSNLLQSGVWFDVCSFKAYSIFRLIMDMI